MPKKFVNRRKNRRPKGTSVGYAKPNFRMMNAPQAQEITLHCNLSIDSGILGTNGGVLPVNWLYFNDAAALAGVYKYFEIVGCKIRFSLATTTAALDSFNGAAIAWYPIDYNNEGNILTTAVPTQRNQVQDLAGSIFVQQGVNNSGKWFYPGIKQQFATSDAFSSTLNRAAGSVLWYVDDIGISERLGDIDLMVNLKFYQREYNASNPSFANVGAYRTKKIISGEERDFVIRSCD